MNIKHFSTALKDFSKKKQYSVKSKEHSLQILRFSKIVILCILMLFMQEKLCYLTNVCFPLEIGTAHPAKLVHKILSYIALVN